MKTHWREEEEEEVEVDMLLMQLVLLFCNHLVCVTSKALSPEALHFQPVVH